MIEVSRVGSDEPLQFNVVVREAGSATRFRVTLSRADCDRLGRGSAPDRLIEAAFRFLLDREPKESILARFDLCVISRYFPEFEHELPTYLAGLEE